MCEVEMFGRVKGAPPGSKPIVSIAVGDCLAADGLVLGTMPTEKDGVFRMEVFAPWGSDLSVCAAVTSDGKPVTSYGKSPGVFHAEKMGEVEFHDVTIELKPGPPRAFLRPTSAPSAGVPHGSATSN